MNSSSDTQRAEDLYMQGLTLLKQKNYQQAIQVFTEAININQNDDRFYLQRGIALKDMGRNKEAIDDYNKTISLNINNKHVYFRRGFIYREQGNTEAAIADYTKDIELNPEDEFSYYRRGIVLDDSGKKEEALQDYMKALEINPSNNLVFSKGDLLMTAQLNSGNIAIHQVYLKRALIYFNKGKYDEAIKDFTQLIEINQQNDEAYYLRGQTYKNQAKFKVAIADIQEASKLKPSNSQYQIEVEHTEMQYLYFDSLYWTLFQCLLVCQQLSTGIFNRYNNRITKNQCLSIVQYVTKIIKAHPNFSEGVKLLSMKTLEEINKTIKLGYGLNNGRTLEERIFRLASITSMYSKCLDIEIKTACLTMALKVDKFNPSETISIDTNRICKIEEEQLNKIGQHIDHWKLGIEHCLDVLVYLEHYYEEIKKNKLQKLEDLITKALDQDSPLQREKKQDSPLLHEKKQIQEEERYPQVIQLENNQVQIDQVVQDEGCQFFSTCQIQ